MFPLKDEQASGKIPWINSLLIALTFFVFFKQLTASSFDLFLMNWSIIPSEVDFSSFSTLIPFLTSNFLHGGWLHIISNMWFLWIFGDNVEDRLGHFTYLFFYLSAGIVANFIQYLITIDSSIPMLGASGAVAGVLGAYMVFFPGHKIDTLFLIFLFPIIIPVPAAIMLLYWFLIQFFSGITALTVSASVGGIAWWAHISGFSFGFLMSRNLKKTL
ncbi:rhomboid family intramembrane serine protease [Candidatus Microgenomates bacterium]|nr:rhomboid family intramembrane serine protease [Candidatus Microgenomates bacterium]